MTKLIGSRSSDLEGHLHARSIVVLPLGALTPHGPHLPLDTTSLLASERARRAGVALEELGACTMVMPTFNFAIARLAQDFPGGITMRPGTLWALVEDMVLSLQQDGVRQVVLCNGHNEFEQVRILRHLCIEYSQRTRTDCQLLYPDGDEAFQPKFAEEEGFGGRRETSMMLALAPGKVDFELAKGLEPLDFKLPIPIPGKNRNLLQIGAERGYLGDPAGATAEEGGALLDEWSLALVSSCQVAWPDLFA
jgi:creatinine amidohydrolase